MSSGRSSRFAVAQWLVVLVVGVAVVAIVGGLALIPRLTAGQRVLNAAAPAFTNSSLKADTAGINIISADVTMADPIVNPQGGAAGEVGAVVAYVAKHEHVSAARALALMKQDFPHTTALLQAIPLSSVTSELPGLLAFLEKTLRLTPAQLTAALKANFPALAQAITDLPILTDDWDAIPVSGAFTRFDGTAIKTVPELRDYFTSDLIPAVAA